MAQSWKTLSLALLSFGAAVHVMERRCEVFPPTSKDSLARHGFDSTKGSAERSRKRVGWLLHRVLALVLRSPTPRANCSSRPPMAPEGLGAAARSPTVLLYAAKKAERTSCSRVSRALRAASLWGRRDRK